MSLLGARASCREGFGLGGALAGTLGDRVGLDLGEEGGHDLGLDVALALDADVLLQRHEGETDLGEGVEDGEDLTQRATESGEFADDQTDLSAEDVPSSSRRCFSEACPKAATAMASRKSCFRGYSGMARCWLRTSCCASKAEDRQWSSRSVHGRRPRRMLRARRSRRGARAPRRLAEGPAGGEAPAPSRSPAKILVESRSGCRSSGFRPQIESETPTSAHSSLTNGSLVDFEAASYRRSGGPTSSRRPASIRCAPTCPAWRRTRIPVMSRRNPLRVSADRSNRMRREFG